MGALVRKASATLPNEMIVFFRNVFALVFVVPIVIMRSGLPEVRTQKPFLHLLRAAAGLTAMYCYFFALAHMKLAEAVLLAYTTPLFIPLIALAWLHESVPRTVRSAVIIGFVGVDHELEPADTVGYRNRCVRTVRIRTDLPPCSSSSPAWEYSSRSP